MYMLTADLYPYARTNKRETSLVEDIKFYALDSPTFIDEGLHIIALGVRDWERTGL
jgi:hypothetical protein